VTAARLGIKVIDGDYAGRAVPEEMQSTHYFWGKKSWPFSSVDRWGNIVIVKEACNPFMMERIGKMLSVAAFRGCAIASTLLRANEMKTAVVPHTLSRCLDVGRAIRQAREQGNDPVRAAADLVDGWVLFEGRVVEKKWDDRQGYLIGDTWIAGTGDWAGRTLRIWFKNENHITWLDDMPWVCSPDLISVVHRESGEGVTNTYLTAGTSVAVIGMKGLEYFRSDAGLVAAGPRHFGFEIEYQPIEQILKEPTI
jgi:hypothetical protein